MVQHDASVDDLVIVPARHTLRWASAAALALAAIAVLHSIATNPRFSWPVVGHYLFSPIILAGLVNTLWLTAIAMAIGIVLGLVLAVMRISSNPVIASAAGLFIWFFRGTPALVQLIFWYNLAALYPTYSFGIPLLAPALFRGSINSLITPFTAAILGLGLNEGAYMAEITRAGLISVDPGQIDAARALGMTPLATMRRVIMPQAMRFLVPPTGNEMIGMLKTTSIVSVIALSDLLYSAQMIYSRNFQTIPLLLVASAWYLAMTSLFSLGQSRLERRFNRAQGRR